MKPQMKITIEIDKETIKAHSVENETSGCWEWFGTITRGYGKYKGYQAHRLAWLAFKDIPPLGFYVLHTCDNRKCVNPEHLYLGTQSDNMRDMWQRGGRTHNTAIAKYNWDIVNKIRSLYKTGDYSFAELGRRFGMNRSMVYKIVNEQIWKPID